MLRSVWRSSCALGASLLLALALAASAVPADAAGPTGWLHTKGSKILDSKNKAHVIRAANWFGMETANCAPHGLWQINLDDGLAEIASFGFNAIRLPFSSECLASAQTTGINYQLNPRLQGKTPLDVMDIVIERAQAHGLSVILDRHRADSGNQSALWYSGHWTEERWISDWTMLADRYRKNPTVIGFDLHNEPHAVACWGCGDPKVDWAAAAQRAGNAILKVNSKLLIIVQGVENPTKGPASWWGGGLADAKAHPIKLKKKHRLVYSTHEYPSTVSAQSWFSAKDYPKNLPAVWNASWGYLQTSKKTPVLIGEFGSKLETTSDRQWLSTLVPYMLKNSMSFAYWSFNPNSSDTGGLVKDDWVTPQEAKLTAIRPLLGPRTAFTPTYSRTTEPTPSATTQPGASSSAPVPTPTTTSPEPEPSASAPPSSTPTGSSPGSTARSGGTEADWRLQSSWPGGYVAELEVTSAAARHGWTVRWPDAAATSVVNAWGMTCSAQTGTITCTGADWASDLAPGQPVRVGVQIATPSAPPAEPVVTVS